MMRAAELYGESLYDLAAEEKQEQDILTEMQDIGTLLRENPKYAALLSEPSIPKEKRLELLDQAFRGENQTLSPELSEAHYRERAPVSVCGHVSCL